MQSVEETLAEPRSGTLKALPETVDTLGFRVFPTPGYIENLRLHIPQRLYHGDAFGKCHGVNHRLLFLRKIFSPGTNRLGLSALLHDVGKTGNSGKNPQIAPQAFGTGI